MISFVAAMDEKRLIGADGSMPWHLPNDLKHFKQVTYGSPVIMGRRTYESIGKALPGRKNVVLTSDTSYEAPGCDILHSLKELQVLAEKNPEEELFVIGGEGVFEQTLPLASRMYLTIIHEHFRGDTYFPAWDEHEWRVVEEKEGAVEEKNRYPHTFLTLERKR
ncbi:dihydrofolate reductase [Salibacterium sp. K-3]